MTVELSEQEIEAIMAWYRDAEWNCRENITDDMDGFRLNAKLLEKLGRGHERQVVWHAKIPKHELAPADPALSQVLASPDFVSCGSPQLDMIRAAVQLSGI